MAKDFTYSHAMSCEAMSQSCYQHVLAVLGLKPLGFPEAVHSPPSAEKWTPAQFVELWGTQFFLSGGDFAGASFWQVAGSGLLCFHVAGWACGWMFWLQEMKLLVMSFVFRVSEEHQYEFLYKYLWPFFFFFACPCPEMYSGGLI